MYGVSSLLLLISGAAALIYQLGWIRLLGLGVGSTAVAVAAILAAFFGGMALGSWLARYWLRAGGNGLKGFALAELLIAGSALALLPLLSRPQWFLVLAPGSDSLTTFALVFMLLLLPTAAIGATYPLLTTWLGEQRGQVGTAIARLYAMNLLGAVLGITIAAFYLIPGIGLYGAITVAVGLNLLSAGIALLYGRKESVAGPAASVTAVSATIAGQPNGRLALLWVLAISGFSLMALEVVWSKYLTIYFGTTLYGFSLMLASVLTGLLLGALVIGPWLGRARVGQLVLLLLALALLLLVQRSALGQLPTWLPGEMFLGELHQGRGMLLVAAILLPTTMLFGAIFPLAMTLYCGGVESMRNRLGAAYAINTLAAIGGAVAVSLWMIPDLGSDTTLLVLSLLPLLALPWLITVMGRRATRLSVYACLPLLLVLAFVSPGLDYERVLNSHFYRYAKSEPPWNYRYLAEGRSGLISLVDYGSDQVFLQRNGLTEAMIHARHAYKGTLAESLLAALPYLLQESPRDAFVIGFGGGTTTRVLANSGLEAITTVELEPKVVEAMMQVGEGQFMFLRDGRVNLEYNDARVSLYATQQRYSIIASQPSHPWLSGGANLYSREFFSLVRSRLREDGIFAQWLNLFRMDAETLRSILRTFYDVFPQGVVFGVMHSGDLILLGGSQPMVLDFERSQAYFANDKVAHTLRYGDLRHVQELPNYFLFTSDEARVMAADAPLATDANLLVETRLAALRLPPSPEEDPYRLIRRYVQGDLNSYRQ